MSGLSGIQPDPSLIGRINKPPFAVPPDAEALFQARATRFAVLAETSDLQPYLRFLGDVAALQARVAAGLPPLPPQDPARAAQAHSGAMPPLDRNALQDDPALHETIRRFLDGVAAVEMPEPARDALASLRAATPGGMASMIRNVLLDSIPVEAVAQHLLLTAAIQIHAVRSAAAIAKDALQPIAPGICPCCGGPPAASRVVGWQGAENARYAACAFCGTQWNEVRVKCLACGSTKGISYRSAETDEAVIKAECCDECRSWVKILHATRNVALDPVADDVASLGLDVLMRETEYRRAGFNPFLIGY